jgi:predicted CXXCH cytochrome family protein
MNEIFSKNRMHWPVMSKQGCLSCHSPHASTESGLLKAPLIPVCGTCHGDTIQRQERAETKHPPIKEGNCTGCHVPHSSDNSFLLNQASVIELCGTCHDWQKHSTHPIGEKIKDPRNKNLTVQCLTCHRTHGTENKHFIYTPVITEMCVSAM